ncbi:MAG: carbon-nitrogen family hydrolase [Deltaproteobacteria bacterium]|nr:carbon-nitrogen family hydrolase [Deltaproteobacteria bacterium]
MKVALVQLDIAWEDKEANLARAEGFAREAAGAGAGLVCFPEMTLTGFSMNIGKTAEPDRGSAGRMAEIAKGCKTAIGFGWVEAFEGRAKNHYTVVSRTGDVLSDYVKLHPFSFANEERFFAPGDALCRFSLGGFNVSTFICYDLRFPEVFQAASREAHLIVVAANWPGARAAHWRTLLAARAIENQCYVAGVNCAGDIGAEHYSGDSMLVDPEGNIIQELSGKEGIVSAAIEVDAVKKYRASFPLKTDRRNALYKDIL